jgi:hypothetical protein
MRAILVVAVCTFAATWSGSARAEGEPEGQDPYYDASGNFAGGLDSNGFALSDGNGGYTQVCLASFFAASGAGVIPAGQQADFSKLLPDGTLIVGGIGGLGTSHDGGCTFTMATDLAGKHVSALVVVGNTLYTQTEDPTSPNGIWQSIDGGQQWTQAFPPEQGLLLFDMAASADGSHIVATGARFSSTPGPAVLVSADGGISFQDVSTGYASFTRVRAGSFDSDGTSILFGGFDSDPTNPGYIALAAAPYTTPNVIGRFPAEVRDVVVFQGTRFGLAYNARSVFKMAPGDTSFTQVSSKDTGPGSCLRLKPDGSALFGCGLPSQNPPTSPMFMTSTDGTTWTTIVTWPSVPYQACPAGSTGASACAQFDEASQCTDGIDNDKDGKTDCADPKCASNPACKGSGGEGEGEGEGGTKPPVTKAPGSCACAGVDGRAPIAGVAFVLLAIVTTRSRRRA